MPIQSIRAKYQAQEPESMEGIPLPRIVVVGHQSVGKSSVVESLSGIRLPSRTHRGICTRVPLIMRLQSHPNPQPEITLEFNGKVVSTNELSVAADIKRATDEIAGGNQEVSSTPMTLTVKKKGVPDLTIVDLPGITWVPILGQPKDIFQRISAIIMEYIKPEENIILNVLSAEDRFQMSQSILMSRQVDKTGERTLAVVTKADIARGEFLLKEISGDGIKVHHGFIVVRNRIAGESFEEARAEEAKLFETHPLLSTISKSTVGIPVLLQKLVQIQGTIILKHLPDTVRKISRHNSLEKMPIGEAMREFVSTLSSAKESLKKIVIRTECDEYSEMEKDSTASRLAEMLNKFSRELQSKCIENEPKHYFIWEEIGMMNEAKGIALPDFHPHYSSTDLVPRTTFIALLQRKINKIRSIPLEFVSKVWDYVDAELGPILMKHYENYPVLQSYKRTAVANLIDKKKEQSINWLKEIIEMEKVSDYTCDAGYLATWNNLKAKEEELMEIMTDRLKPTTMTIDGFGEIDVEHLRNYDLAVVLPAFDLRMRMTAYWKIVMRRLVDHTALHIINKLRNLVNNDMEGAIINDLMGPEAGELERLFWRNVLWWQRSITGF